MRALSHPVRIALLEVLSLYGPMTATEAGERIGESPTTCSFHLRQLARFGFVEEAGRGKGRARPWQMTSIGMRLRSDDGDRETEIALTALARLLRQHFLERYHNWIATRAAFPRAWRDAAGESEYAIYLTSDELEQLSGELAAVLRQRFHERLTDPSARPPGALPVEVLVLAYPIDPPADER